MQSKLKLDLDQLQVESFDTHPGAVQKRGTVHGHQYYCCCCCCCPCCCGGTGFTACGQHTCAASCNGTCDASCNGTCDASCNGTCGGTCDYSACYGTCGYTCEGCTVNDGTCRGYGSCGSPYGECYPIP